MADLAGANNNNHDDGDDDYDDNDGDMMMMMVIMIMIIRRRIIMIIIVTIIKIALNGAIRDFYDLLTAPRICLQYVRSSGQGVIICKARATHRALITCSMSCATWYAGAAHAVKFDRVEIAFI